MYRREVWNVFKCHAPDDGAVVLLPSIEGLEIELARTKGFSTADMHVIDMNPAIVAHIKRRYPRVTTYGVTVERAFAERMAAKQIRVRCANLDFTGPVTVARLRELQAVAESGVLVEGACVGVTVLRGRETREGFKHLNLWERVYDAETAFGQKMRKSHARLIQNQADVDQLTVTDISRLQSIGFALNSDEVIRAGVYKSSNGCHTMLWAVYRCSRLDDVQLLAGYRALLEQNIAFMEGVEHDDPELDRRIEAVAPGWAARSRGL